MAEAKGNQHFLFRPSLLLRKQNIEKLLFMKEREGGRETEREERVRERRPTRNHCNPPRTRSPKRTTSFRLNSLHSWPSELPLP